MKSALIRTLLLFVSIYLLSASNLQGQALEIQITMSPPFPTNLDAYVDRLEDGVFVVRNTTNAPVEAFFEASLIERNGLLSITTNGVLSQSIIIGAQETLILSPMEVQDIFSGLKESNFVNTGLSREQLNNIYLSRQMPEGSYELCVKAFDANQNLLSDPSLGCASFEVLYPERPIIEMPFNEDFVEPMGSVNIIWSHVLNSADASLRTEYIVKIIDLTEEEITNPIEAMVSPNISAETEIEAGQSLSYTLFDDTAMPLVEGHSYALRVTAVDPEGFIFYQFGGHSEVITFTYQNPIPPEPVITQLDAPIIINPKVNEVTEAKGIKVDWSQAFDKLNDKNLVSSFEYNLRILDVTSIKNNKIGKLMVDPNTNFLYNETKRGFTEYIQLSRAVPLVVGNRYSAMVVFKSDSLLPSGFEVSNPNSKIVTFTYGDPNNDFQPDFDPELANHVQGEVKWAFLQDEENNEISGKKLVVKSTGELTSPSLNYGNSNQGLGSEKYDLEGASVVIIGMMQMGWWYPMQFPIPIGVGTSREDGRYAIALNDAHLSTMNEIYLEISHPSNQFQKYRQRIYLDKTEFGYLMKPVTLGANSMRLSMQVLKEDLQEFDEVKVNLLLQKDNFDNYPFLAQVAPMGGQLTRQYNDDTYTVVQTIEDGSIYKGLFQNAQQFENYVYEIEVAGMPSAFFPQRSIYYAVDSKKKKQLPHYHTNLTYNIGTEIKGTVYFGDKPQRDVLMIASFERNDVLGSFQGETSFTRMTDKDGDYHFDNLPNLLEGAIINIKIQDYSIRNQAFNEKIEFEGTTPIEKDIYLKNDVYTGFGRVVDQFGIPVSNALITKDSTTSITTTKDGLYMMKLNEPMYYYMDIVADNYENSYLFSMAEWYGLGEDIRNINGDLSPTDKAKKWKSNLEANKDVRKVMDENNVKDVDAAFFGIGFGELDSRYTTYFDNTENLKGTIGFPEIVMKNKYGGYKIEAYYKDELVQAKIVFEGADDFVKEDELTSGQAYYFTAPDGAYNFSITSVPGGPEFVQFFGELEMDANRLENVTIYLDEGTKVFGSVKDFKTKELVEEAKITIEGLPYNTSTDKDGKYVLILPHNNEYTFRIKKRKYNRLDTLLLVQKEDQEENFLIDPRDGNLPDFVSLSDYKVEVDFLEAVDGGFRISGLLNLEANKLFTPAKGEEQLEFKDVIVFEDSDNADNAIPKTNFFFEQAEMNATMYDYAPVVVKGQSLLEMRRLESTDPKINSKSVIGGTKLVLDFASKPATAAFPFKYPNAYLRNSERSDYVEDKLRELGFSVGGNTPEEIEAQRQSADNKAQLLFSELNFERVFVSPGSKVKELTEFAEFKVNFMSPDHKGLFDVVAKSKIDDYRDSDKYKDFVVSEFAMTKLLVKKGASKMDRFGVHMEGFAELPKMLGINMLDDRVIIDKLSIGKNFSINEFTFRVTPDDPFKFNLGTFEARLISLSFFGIGTTNVGLGFGGSIRMLKDSEAGDEANKLVINQFKVVKGDPWPTVAADLSFGPKGVNIKGLEIKQEKGKSVYLEMDFDKMAFQIKADNLLLNYTKNKAAAKKIFPMEVQEFRLQTKDFGVFLLLKPNLSTDFGIAKIRLDKVLVNIGYGYTFDQMNDKMKMTDEEREAFAGQQNKNTDNLTAEEAQIIRKMIEANKAAGKNSANKDLQAKIDKYNNYVMELQTKYTQDIGAKWTKEEIDIMKGEIDRERAGGQKAPDFFLKAVSDWDFKNDKMEDFSGGDKLMSEAKMSWAFGLAGGIEFGALKGMSGNTFASFMIGEDADGFQFRFNELAMHLEQNNFKLDIRAALSISGYKQGFEASGQLETMKKGFEAAAKFWKYESGGIEVGAKLVVKAAITTGPITWHKIGGGFDFNTHNKIYSVEVVGTASPVGTPKEVVAIDDINLKVIYNSTWSCDGIPVVVEGGAKLTMADMEMGSVKAKLDFCRYSGYLQIDRQMSLAKELFSMKITGMLYVMKKGSGAAAFVGVAGAVSDKWGIFKGNADASMGINFSVDTNTPYAVKSSFNRLPDIAKVGGRFHGLSVKATVKVPTKKGSYGITVAGFKALTVDVSASASAYAFVYKSFDSSRFQVKGELDLSASAQLYVLGSEAVGGSADVDLKIDGGYDSSWYFKASGGLNLKVWNKSGLSCGTVKFPTCRDCRHWCGWPCGWFDWCLGCYACTDWPCGIIPHFKKCTDLRFSFYKRQGKSATFSFN